MVCSPACGVLPHAMDVVRFRACAVGVLAAPFLAGVVFVGVVGEIRAGGVVFHRAQ